MSSSSLFASTSAGQRRRPRLRAQFSPVTHPAAASRDVTRGESRLGVFPPVGGSASVAIVPNSAEAPELRWWDPHLLDRLQPPLTRYRD